MNVATPLPVKRCPKTSVTVVSTTTLYSVRGFKAASRIHVADSCDVSLTPNDSPGSVLTCRSTLAPRTGVLNSSLSGPVGQRVPGRERHPAFSNRNGPYV